MAFIVPKLANQGPVLVVRDLVAGLKKRGVECKVYYFDEVNEVVMDCEVCRIDFKEGFDFDAYDIVHSHCYRPDLYVAKHRSAMRKCKCVTTLHNYMQDDLRFRYNRWVSMVFSRVWLRALRKQDLIVTLSKHAMGYYRRWFPEGRLTYVYNAKSVDRTKDLTGDERERLLQFKGGNRLIGVNALLTARKGVDQLIKALPALPGYVLAVVGDGQERKALERLAERRGVGERCLFVGYQKDAFRYLPYYDVYAMVSRSEGFPLSLIEAAAYGVPTVCSRIPILEETFTEDEVSFFTLEDVDSLREAILRLASRGNYGENFRRAYDERYTLDRMVDGYWALYKDVCK